MLIPKAQPVKCKRHTDWIAGLPCCVCGAPAVCHHVIHGPHGGRLLKSDDRCVPLCPSHHNMSDDSVHMDGDEGGWFAGKGIDHHRLASDLWAVSGDHEAGAQVVAGMRAAA